MSHIHTDQELIEKVISNDRKAQFKLFELTKRMVYSLAFRILNNEEDAHDVLQETYVDVFQQIKKLTHHEALIAWMKTITVRKAIQKSKKRIHFEQLEKVNEQAGEELNVWFDAEILDQAIRGLPAGARAVFMLVAVEGYPHQECAKLLGISESTSKSQLNYAKNLLKKRLKILLQA